MTIKKKIIALCAVFILTAGMFALVGCGGDNGSTTGGGDTEASVEGTDNGNPTDSGSEQTETPTQESYTFAVVKIDDNEPEPGPLTRRGFNGEWIRFGEEMIPEIAKEQGFKYKISYLDLDAALAAVASGEVDAVVLSGEDASSAPLDKTQSYYSGDSTYVYGVATGQSADLLELLDTGLTTYLGTPEYEQLLENHT